MTVESSLPPPSHPLDQRIVACLRAAVPDSEITYRYGSIGGPFERADSDLDLAILAGQRLCWEELGELASSLAASVQREVDLNDMRALPVTLRMQIVMQGVRLYASIIERSLQRSAEEYRGRGEEPASNFTRQDANILKQQRAREASIGAALHLVRIHRLDIPNESRQAFALLTQARRLESELVQRLAKMVGFRNVAVHDYHELDIEIVRPMLDVRPGDLKDFAAYLLRAGLADQTGEQR